MQFILSTLFVVAKVTSADWASTEWPYDYDTYDYDTYDVDTSDVDGEIECGEILNVENEDFRVDVPWNETRTFSFTNGEEQSVVFTNCGSYGDTYMKLLDSDGNDITNQSVGGCTGNDCTGGNAWNGSDWSCSNGYEYVWNRFSADNDGRIYGGYEKRETFAMANLPAGDYYLEVGWTNPDAMRNVTTYTTEQVGWYGAIPVYTTTVQNGTSPVFVAPLCFNDCENVYWGSNWWGGTDHWESTNWEWCPSRYTPAPTGSAYDNDTDYGDYGDDGSSLSAVVAMATLCVIGLFTM